MMSRWSLSGLKSFFFRAFADLIHILPFVSSLVSRGEDDDDEEDDDDDDDERISSNEE